jgi:uncharacterized protein
MICPRCKGDLIEAAKHGVVLDHCPGCGGIWLDQGEIGKIITHMKQVESSLDAEFHQSNERRDSYRRHDDKQYDKHHNKKKSGFGKLFDIFD